MKVGCGREWGEYFCPPFPPVCPINSNWRFTMNSQASLVALAKTVLIGLLVLLGGWAIGIVLSVVWCCIKARYEGGAEAQAFNGFWSKVMDTMCFWRWKKHENPEENQLDDSPNSDHSDEDFIL